MTSRDELASILADNLNKQFSESKVAYFLDGTDITPTDIKEFVSTGSTMLDLAISNKAHGGIAVGRITEINGLESSGKSLLGAHILAETQRQGGVAVYIDTETSVSTEFLAAIGIDVNNMLYLHLETVEDVFSAIEEIVAKVRESDKDRLVAILVDSLAGATTKVELEGDFDKEGWATAKAIIISKAMRKITQMIGREKIALVFTNQLRQKLGVMFGDPWTTSGGKALPFHASTRIRLKNLGQIKDTGKNTIGMKIRAQVIKNRLGPPMRHADFDLYFETGIDDPGSWLRVLKDHKLVKNSGAWYTMDDHTGEEIKFQSKNWSEKLSDKDFKNHIYDMICDTLILKYDQSFGIDDVTVTVDEVEDV
jgi:recombination protein RecA|tara:strand:+ start:1347 stop:2444 length:1098 start_codon:yes stop_codon:yes gene_type:complete